MMKLAAEKSTKTKTMSTMPVFFPTSWRTGPDRVARL